ncbi:glycoside hydrolase family 43 protein [Calocera cornea HHB12733]|uniref:Glycoside hydrolase family 43 protein n=1 Tax=Calocera cornea HHB12733 TaxID=1353952 RepID=A0A165HAI4_9BASI|nr:glycoside hydrolase family 43 protein [Calocera cornea HHB12733]
MPSYKNPIIPGYNPDPSCIKVGDTFYLVCSSFLAFPAVPIYASHDLVSWKQIGNVVTRDSQLDLTNSTVTNSGESSGIWAPTIRYHDGLFYVVTTRVDMSKPWDDETRYQNLIWTCKDPFNDEWSDAVEFIYPGFDTSLFFDDDGKCYMQGTESWKTFALRQISQYEIDVKTGKALSETRQLWTGEGGIFPEAPHVFKKGSWYYLLTAEGGTYLDHSAMLARAPSVWGPYERCPSNPVLRPPPRDELIQTVGHADFFESEPGVWWAVALATRMIGPNSPMGRETVLIPGDFSGDWPVWDQPVKSVMTTSHLPPTKALSRVGAFIVEGSLDAFGKGGKFAPQWIFLRNPIYANYEIASPSELLLKGTAGTLSSHTKDTTFVARRQQDLKFTASVTLSFTASGSEEAGFTVFLDPIRHYEVFVSAKGVGFRTTVMGGKGLQSGVGNFLGRDAPQVKVVDAVAPAAQVVSFKVVGVEDKFTFYLVEGGKETELGTGPASEVSGGFCGTLVGVYASGNGSAASTPAKFTDFKYEPVA